MKNYKVFILFLLLSIISCDRQKSTTEKTTEIIQNNDAKHIQKTYEEAGDLISEITFELLPTSEQKADWPDGIIPWISIENSEKEVSQLINPNEIVVKQNKINLIIDYPLNKPTTISFSNPKGFTRKDLALEISKQYHKIYTEEEATAKTKTIPVEQRTGLINRNETDGKYGIWGHDIGDLVLSGIEVHQTKDGEINLVLMLNS